MRRKAALRAACAGASAGSAYLPAALSITAPQRLSNLTVYPLTAPAHLDADYLVLDEALRRKLASVTEVSCGGSVPELAFDNQADEGVLLLDGEELVGARQNRVLNITILVGGHKNIVIPVSSVEHGRWRYNSDEFASADRALFSKARGKKMRQVSASMRESGTRRSDQGEGDDVRRGCRGGGVRPDDRRQRQEPVGEARW